MAPLPPTPEFMDDVTASLAPELLSEILLRLPPDEPGHLFRAALVCKEWLRAICDLGFLRRYRAFHGSPPLLGLLHRRQVLQGDPVRHLARTTAVPLFPDPTFRRALLHASDDGWYLIVWDPVTGEQHRVPEPGIPWLIYTAAVFCAVSGCAHLDCHGGPFRVVFVATDDEDELVKASVYSSETRRRRVHGASQQFLIMVIKPGKSVCKPSLEVNHTVHLMSSPGEEPLSEMKSTSHFGTRMQSSSTTGA